MCERYAAAQVPSKGKVQQLKNKFKTDRGFHLQSKNTSIELII